jgi:hypothetical protein
MVLDGTQITVQDPSSSKQTGSEIGASVPNSHADRNGPPGITPRAGSFRNGPPGITPRAGFHFGTAQSCHSALPLTIEFRSKN